MTPTDADFNTQFIPRATAPSTGINRAELDVLDTLDFRVDSNGIASKSAPIPSPLQTQVQALFESPAQTDRPSVQLQSLSFGATNHYARAGGLHVMSDLSPSHHPLDLAVHGISPDGHPALIAAFVKSPSRRSIQIRIKIHCDQTSPITIRADANASPRIREIRLLPGPDGIAVADLNILNLPLNRPCAITETWNWQILSPTNPPVQIQIPVRIYVTSQSPLSDCPRESFYRLACLNAPAANAEQTIWKQFTSPQPLQNALGETLHFRPSKPSIPNDHLDPPDHDPSNDAARHLLATTVAGSIAWAQLLAQTFAIQNVDAQIHLVRPNLNAIKDLYRVPIFQLKNPAGRSVTICHVGILAAPFNWTPNQIPPSTTPQESIAPGDFQHPIEAFYNFLGPPSHQAGVHDLGRPVQGSAQQPAASTGILPEHALVLVQDHNGQRWYDPAFAQGPFQSLAHYEAHLLAPNNPNGGGLYAVTGCQVTPPGLKLRLGALRPSTPGLLQSTPL